MEHVVQSKHDFSIVSEKNETIASVTIEPMGEWFYLTNVWVHHEYRKQGLGTQVMQAAIDVYNDRPIYLNVVPYTNRPLDINRLCEWYGKFGFKPVAGTPGILTRQPYATGLRPA
jgi:ribosomal protein S18 acetylase RimI-like enzyme